MTEEERTEVTDGDLVDQARRGDEAAMNALVHRHTDSVYRVALAITRDPHASEDVVQETFVKAFRALDRFRGEASFRTWLTTIAANTARGMLRKVGRRAETDIDSVAEPRDHALDPGEAAELAGEAARARAALAELPEKQRLSIQLRIEGGMSFREVGEAIGSSEGAARVNYFHGIRRLREMLS